VFQPFGSSGWDSRRLASRAIDSSMSGGTVDCAPPCAAGVGLDEGARAAVGAAPKPRACGDAAVPPGQKAEIEP